MSPFNFFKPEKEATSFSQESFVHAVQQGGVLMERATSKLMDYFKGYQWMFYNKYGLHKEEAIDAYTDAVMVLISYIRLGKLDVRYQLSTYLFRLTKNKCIDCLKQRGRGKNLQTEEIPGLQLSDQKQSLLHEVLLSEAYKNVIELLDQFKGHCKEIILKWGYWGYSMQEIAQSLKLKNADVARTQKGRCLKRLRAEIKENSEFPTPIFN